MSRWVLAVVAVVVALGAYIGVRTFAQSPSPTSADASLFTAQIAKIRQAADDSRLGIWRDRLLKRARNEAAAPLPLKEKGNLAVAPIVPRLALAAVLTDDESLRSAAVSGMRELLALDSWTSDRHGGMCDLHTADTALPVALAYHLLRAQLSSQDRRAIVSGLSRLAMRPYLSDARRRRLNLINTNNWNGVINGGLLATALLLEPEGSRRVESAAREFLPAYLNHFASDGGWDEAADYLWYGLRSPAFAAYVAGKRGRPLVLPDATFRAPQWQERFTSPTGRTPAFGDATWWAKPSSAAGYLALVSRNDAALRLFAQRAKSTDPLDLLYLADLGALEPPQPSPPADFYASPTGWAIVHKGDAWLVVRGGMTSSNHSHLDLGSFALEARGELLLTDPGVPQPYPYAEGYFDAVKRWLHPAVRSSSHSVILIDGEGQTLTARFDTRVDGGAIVGEMQHGYGESLKRWERRWRLDADSLSVEDHLELTEALPVTWVFVSPQPWMDTVRTRHWESAGLNLDLASSITPQGTRREPAVLQRAYPLHITLPPADSFEISWEFSWTAEK